MNDPSVQEAERLLREAEGLNPGPWAAHSRYTAKAAQCIAERHPELDPQKAYVLGLLHDIGRREGRSHLKHVLDGYHFLQNLGYPDGARISLTHSFAIPDLDAYVGEHDCTPREMDFIKEFISSVKPTEYDSLIMFCDGIALPSGFCLMEKRLVDVAVRLGINDKTIPSWQARFRIKEHFEGIIGCSIYRILPGVVETTFGADLDHEL